MRELSLHILDIIENSIRTGGGVILLAIEEDSREDLLRIVVEDNGSGLPVSPESALDPFYTTKPGKRVGLGLSLLAAAAHRAGGQLCLRRSALGGLAVVAEFKLRHIDRHPLGDLAATLSAVVCTNPRLDLRCRFKVDGRQGEVRVGEVAEEMKADEIPGLAVARRFSEKVREAVTGLGMTA